MFVICFPPPKTLFSSIFIKGSDAAEYFKGIAGLAEDRDPD